MAITAWAAKQLDATTMRLSLDAPPLGHRSAEARAPMRPDTLAQALQLDLIPLLTRAHSPALMPIPAPEVDAFTADLLDGGDRAMLARLDRLRQRGFASEDLCLDLLAPAARKLGALWDDDRCDFTSVTIGVGHLQRLMRLLGPQGEAAAATHTAGLQLLLVRACR